MELQKKLRILADAAKYDVSCASSGSRREKTGQGLGSTEGMGICHSYTPDGRCVSLLKILFTNHCIYDCRYCISRRSSDVERARFTVDEVVRLTLDLYRRNYIEGLFLSSGIHKSPDATMEQLIEVARRLREEESFFGYVHLKAVAGASPELVATAGRYADRVSCNVELPTERDLARLAPEKRLPLIQDTMGALRHTSLESAPEKESAAKPSVYLPAGQSTQMMVGATSSSDHTILTTSMRLYTAYDLRRVYYTAYSPIEAADALLPSGPPSLLREHRLYQADWLLRRYGFDVDELTPEGAPDLDLEMDPKLSWALRHRERFPVDLMRADKETLLRVPGIGQRSVERLLRVRRHKTLTFEDLRRLRVSIKKAGPFVFVPGDARAASGALDALNLRSRFRRHAQLDLFAAPAGARSSEV